MSNEIHLVSGGFDPIHSGHVDLITAAGHYHVTVALNSDEWLIRKKGNYFLPWHERAKILHAMDRVARVIKFNDDDDSACDAIKQLKAQYPDYIIHFYNGGDRDGTNILEAIRYAGDPQVKLHFGTGGTVKKNASSDILKRWEDVQKQTTERNWGVYDVLAEYDGAKVKTLTVEPGESLSMQKHQFRAEYWFVVDGTATVELGTETIILNKHESLTIPQETWHKLSNHTDKELHIVEIQYGERCEESDITRQNR